MHNVFHSPAERVVQVSNPRNKHQGVIFTECLMVKLPDTVLLISLSEGKVMLNMPKKKVKFINNRI